MINLSKESKLSREDVIKKALEYWGPGGYGLTVTQQAETYAAFEGAGGGVEVVARTRDGKTEVEILSREWDSQATSFLDKI